MNLRRTVFGLASIALLLAGAVRTQRWLWLAAPLLSSGLLWLAQRPKRSWAVSLWLAVQVLSSALLAEPGWLLLPAALLALAYWDLTGFEMRLDQAPPLLERDLLVRRHLMHLAAALLLGAALSTAALAGRLQLSFVGAAFLVILVLVGISLLISGTRETPADTGQS